MQSEQFSMAEGAFDFALSTRVVYGVDCLSKLGDVIREVGGERTLVVTDAGLVKAGHVARAEAFLVAAGIEVAVHDAVRENPTTLDVDRCVEAARDFRCDSLVGLGGGSSLDTAKGCNFLLSNGGRMEDYWGVGKASRPMLPFVAVPTTSGTGSELQSFALIAREDDHQKMACGDKKAAARFALLDPKLTGSMPGMVAAFTGLDALTHAVETAVTSKRNEISCIFSRASFRRLARQLPRVLAGEADLEARGEMLIGAALAGLAIENSMLGAAHSLANPLTAHHDVIHGQAVGTMLPHVVRFNSADPAVAEEYAELARVAGLAPTDASPAEGVEVLIARLFEVLDSAPCPATLAELGVPAGGLSALAEEAAKQWTAGFNPRPVGPEEMLGLYRAAHSGTR